MFYCSNLIYCFGHTKAKKSTYGGSSSWTISMLSIFFWPSLAYVCTKVA